MQQTKVAIVGAGLAGLCCARQLAADGVACRIFEASDRVGGRVATDCQDGFLLDRGFQVFLTSYPEAQIVLDYGALELAAFTSGALVHHGGKNRRVVDAWRQPLHALWSLRSPVLPLRDIPRIIGLRRAAMRADHRLSLPADLTAADYLNQLGFSEAAMQRFFRPFFGGVTLDAALTVPARYFLFLFEMFARGSATLPVAGMQAIPEQIAASLPPDTVQLQAAVTKIEGSQLELGNGERVATEHIVLATEASAAAPLLDAAFDAPASNSTTTIYYGADRSELGEPILLLTGDGSGPVNHLCFPSDVQPSYAPQGAALASVSVLGITDLDDRELDRDVRKQLKGWMSDAVDRWQLLRIDRVKRALPRIANADGRGIREISDVITLCGDHLLTPSIQGAMLAGRHAAERARQSVAR
ncbi:MAG: phytoene dehydrogenase-like protein [Planctomycetota bacterium]|jgi:phytoene dehydrogenase-like protein